VIDGNRTLVRARGHWPGGLGRDACSPARLDAVVFSLRDNSTGSRVDNVKPRFVSAFCTAGDPRGHERRGLATTNRGAREALCQGRLGGSGHDRNDE
jgi:hypothetical protein